MMKILLRNLRDRWKALKGAAKAYWWGVTNVNKRLSEVIKSEPPLPPPRLTQGHK